MRHSVLYTVESVSNEELIHIQFGPVECMAHLHVVKFKKSRALAFATECSPSHDNVRQKLIGFLFLYFYKIYVGLQAKYKKNYRSNSQ